MTLSKNSVISLNQTSSVSSVRYDVPVCGTINAPDLYYNLYDTQATHIRTK